MKMLKCGGRISLIGGGTDLPEYSDVHGGAVISGTSINGTTVFMLNPSEKEEIEQIGGFSCFPGFMESQTFVRKIEDAVMARIGIRPGEFTLCVSNDVARGSGLGLSSATIVAVISGICKLNDYEIDNSSIAMMAHEIERQELGNVVGYQDHFAAAFPGFNHIKFGVGGRITIEKLNHYEQVIDQISKSLLLLSTEKRHSASSIEKIRVANISKTLDAYCELKDLTKQVVELIENDFSIAKLASIINRSWELKKTSSPASASSIIDVSMDLIQEMGAYGSKMMGAGEAGTIMVLIPPERRDEIIRSVPHLRVIKGGFAVQKNLNSLIEVNLADVLKRQEVALEPRKHAS